MIGFPIGVLTVNAFEWYAHKYVLHGVPRKDQARYSPVPNSMKSHWAHHKLVRTSAYYDEGYTEGLSNWRVRNEVRSLLLLAAATTLVAPIAPFFTLGTYYGAAKYFYVHRRSHLDPEWGKKAIPWHYDHHMNSNQDANWCVTRPWFDYIMGTRVISDPTVAETNPLGINLPSFLEKPINRLARKLLPHAYARMDTEAKLEATQHSMLSIPALVVNSD